MKNNVIWATMFLQMKNSFARKTFQFTLLAQPILYTCITYYMFKNSGIDNFIAYVILGSGLLSLWSCIVFSSAGDIDRERWMGTLSFLYAAPTSFVKVIIAKVIGNTLLSLFPFILSYLFSVVVFKQSLFILHVGWFFVVMVLSFVSFMCIAFLFASFFTLSRKASYLMNFLEYPIFILCGMAFPIDMLPNSTRLLSYALSPTWASNLLRQCIHGISDWQTFYEQIGVLILLSVCYFLLALKLFRYIDKKVRINATLEVS